MPNFKGPLLSLAMLLVVVVAAYFWFAISGMPAEAPAGSDASTNAAEPFVPGPPPPDVVEMLRESKGFQALVSYTDSGFEPGEVAIEKGGTIRFTNNSSGDLWVAADGTAENPVYHGTSECGGSAFDSCRTLAPREFWEFTFEKSGTWLFRNNLKKGQTGAVRVEVL
ncbi:MAG: hypothetical protein NUV59_04395 [Patescibacteria group bacterium]|nr:hypothetical protein [Patescibacteria group bacterium]